MANFCKRCGDALDRLTGRHMDEGQVMSAREDQIHCRELGPIRTSLLDRVPLPRSTTTYRGFDIVETVST